MIILIALIFRVTLTRRIVDDARRHAEQNLAGRMEGHAAMDMSVTEGPLLSRLTSPRGFTAVSHYYVMDWASVWLDVAGGFLIAGALAAWVPDEFWRDFFLADHETLAKIEGPLVGPLVAIISFVCSIGNVPLAAVLWRGGISFGGVVSFIFADLIVLPILDIYRRYYGWRVARGDVLRRDGRRRLRRRVRLRRRRHHPRQPPGRGHQRGAVAQLHDGAERHLPRPLGAAGRPLPPHRRHRHAARDEPPAAGRWRARSRRARSHRPHMTAQPIPARRGAQPSPPAPDAG